MVNDILYHSKVLSICINKNFRFRSPLKPSVKAHKIEAKLVVYFLFSFLFKFLMNVHTLHIYKLRKEFLIMLFLFLVAAFIERQLF